MARTLALIALCVLLLRAVVFFQLDADPRFDRPASDSWIYHLWAEAWATGEEYPLEPDGEPFWRSPAYPLFVSGVYRLFDSSFPAGPRAVAAVQMLLGAAAAVAAAAWALRRWGKTEAWLAALLASCHAPLLFFEATLLPVGLATPLFTFAGLALADHLTAAGRARRAGVAAGLLTGLAAVVRPNLGLAVPVGALLVWRGRRGGRAALLYTAAALLPLALSTAWNFARSGEAVVTGANGPFNLQYAYGPQAGPSFRATDAFSGSPNQRGMARDVAAIEQGLPRGSVSTTAASRHFAGKALTWIGEHPLGALELAGQKALGVLSWRDFGIVMPMAASRDSIGVLRWLWVPFPLILFLAAAGAWRRRKAAALFGFAFLPILAGAILFFTYTRFRVPAVPLLAVAGAGGAVALARMQWSARRAGIVGAAAALLVFAGTPWWLGLRAGEPAPWATAEAQSFWMIGTAWIGRYERSLEAGAPDETAWTRATEAFARTAELNPGDPRPTLALARAERDLRGDGRRAWELLDAAAARWPWSGAVLGELAACELRGFGPAGPDPERADALFRQAQEQREMYTSFLPDWADALDRLGRREEALEKLRLALELGVWTQAEREALEARFEEWTGRPPPPPKGPPSDGF